MKNYFPPISYENDMLDDRYLGGVTSSSVSWRPALQVFGGHRACSLNVGKLTANLPQSETGLNRPMTKGHDMHISANRQDLRRALLRQGDVVFS